MNENSIMPPVLEALAAALERPRELTAQVARYLTNTYNVERETIGSFLTGRLSELEDDDIDLILSPLFTPKLADQAVLADVLGTESIPRQRWPELIHTLRQRPTVARLVTQDGSTHHVELRDVVIERYVHRLRLDGAIAPAVADLIEIAPPGERPLLKAVARRATWETPERLEILHRYLKNALQTAEYTRDDVIELLNRAESYRPADVEDLLARIPRWQSVLKEEIQAGSTRPFFSSTIHDSHGGDRDHRGSDEARLASKQRELQQLDRLQRLLTLKSTA